VTGSFTARLWSGIEGTYARIVEHSFIRSLAEGTLPIESFGYFLIQDALYLKSYAEALRTLGGLAPTPDDAAFFVARASRVADVERALHETLLSELSLTDVAATAEPSPTTLAYTSYVLANVRDGSFLRGLCSVLPCYWIYWEVGKDLGRRGSPDALYQRWINTYESEDFAQAVRSVLRICDRIGQSLDPNELDAAQSRFRTASRYEWMFWDAAWRREAWPITT
jgi:thiaminase/transcriptional activator TenA